MRSWGSVVGVVAVGLAASVACGLMPPEQQGGAPQAQQPPPPGSVPTVNPTGSGTPDGGAPGAGGPDAGAPDGGPPSPLPGYTLVFDEEFDGTALDTGKWTADVGKRESGVSTPDAVSVANGVMTITTYTEAGVHKTGFVASDGKFAATYGYYEARIRFNTAPGSWCSFWLYAPTIDHLIGDPADAGVEVDIVEHRAEDQSHAQLKDDVAVALNWDGYGADHKNDSRLMQLAGGAPVQGAWHTYSLLWTKTGYVYYVDGQPLWAPTQPISQRSENLELTCEIWDRSWAGYIPSGGYGTKQTSTATMEVDWVRVWQPAQ
jgi:beta-glucanase (GH16 family)